MARFLCRAHFHCCTVSCCIFIPPDGHSACFQCFLNHSRLGRNLTVAFQGAGNTYCQLLLVIVEYVFLSKMDVPLTPVQRCKTIPSPCGPAHTWYLQALNILPLFCMQNGIFLFHSVFRDVWYDCRLTGLVICRSSVNCLLIC